MITSITDKELQELLTPMARVAKELYLSDNLVSSLDLDWLPSNLRLLYLDSNRLVSMSRNMINTLDKLRTSLRLKMGNNP